MNTNLYIAREKNKEYPSQITAEPAKMCVIGMSRGQLGELLTEIGIPASKINMRVNQLWNWIYVRGKTEFAEMTSLNKNLRGTLDKHFTLKRPVIVNRQIAQDGTRKWLLRTESNNPENPSAEFECVFIPDVKRGTLCLSSQIGCTLTCSFCRTGTQLLVRNLTTEEIVGQIMLARDEIGEWPNHERPEDGDLPTAERMITNIVLMGMGEPLYNFENVCTAMSIAADNDGLNFSKRRITLSTSGVVPKIPRWGTATGSMLAISLHATNDTLRNTLVPINKKYPIDMLLAACRAYPRLNNTRRITFEYVMIKGVNDSEDEARKLAQLLDGIPAKINLIPFNVWPGSQYECSDAKQINQFATIINQAGYASPVRTPRGSDIMAACGQLKSTSERLTARERRLMTSAE